MFHFGKHYKPQTTETVQKLIFERISEYANENKILKSKNFNSSAISKKISYT